MHDTDESRSVGVFIPHTNLNLQHPRLPERLGERIRRMNREHFLLGLAALVISLWLLAELFGNAVAR